MRIVFWGKGNRGVSCLHALQAAGRTVSLVVVHPGDERAGQASVGIAARSFGIPTIAPDDPNSMETRMVLAHESADLFVLGGYGKIIRQEVIDLPRRMCINLHGGKLPEYRGSSPMNWVLIRGESTFTLSIIKVASGVDTGDVIFERTFPIAPDATIMDLHAVADAQFPDMLCMVVAQIEAGMVNIRPQDSVRAAYFPLRFPDDGFIVWDMYSASQIHNRIRALTDPYPGAFTYWNERKVKILRSMRSTIPYYGEPGRIYRITERGLLVCASDQCLWITRAMFEDDGTALVATVRRYDQLATMRAAVQSWYRAHAGTPVPTSPTFLRMESPASSP